MNYNIQQYKGFLAEIAYHLAILSTIEYENTNKKNIILRYIKKYNKDLSINIDENEEHRLIVIKFLQNLIEDIIINTNITELKDFYPVLFSYYMTFTNKFTDLFKSKHYRIIYMPIAEIFSDKNTAFLLFYNNENSKLLKKFKNLKKIFIMSNKRKTGHFKQVDTFLILEETNNERMKIDVFMFEYKNKSSFNIITELNNIYTTKANKTFLNKINTKILYDIEKISLENDFLITDDIEYSAYIQLSSYLYTFLDEYFITKYLDINDNRIKQVNFNLMAISNNDEIGNTYSFRVRDVKNLPKKLNKFKDNLYYIYLYYTNKKQKKFFDINKIPEKFKKYINPNSVNKKEIILEKKKDFQQLNLNLKKLHTEDIKEELNKKLYNVLFLLGNPGIGKTYSVLNTISNTVSNNNEFHFFIYASSRKKINESLIDEYKENMKNLKRNYIALTLNQQNVKSRKFSIQCNNEIEDIIAGTLKNIEYFNEVKVNKKIVTLNKSDTSKISTFNDKDTKITTIHYQEIEGKGVYEHIKDILNLISQKLKHKIKTNVLLTLSLQAISNKKTSERFINLEELKSNFKKIKKFYIMFDEITTETSIKDMVVKTHQKNINMLVKSSGSTIENKYNIKNDYKINFIVADASILTENVLKDILNEKDTKYNSTIFIEKNENKKTSLILKKDIEILAKNGNYIKRLIDNNYYNEKLINVNSFPANKLKINFDIIKFQFKEEIKKIKIEMKKLYKEHITKLLPNEQIIIYYQDKKYQEIIKNNLIENGMKKEEVEIINSNINMKKEKNPNFISTVKCYIITSSASRGLSFPMVKKVFVFVPLFEFENQIMEIIQLIFRPRGKTKKLNKNDLEINYENENKELYFYMLYKEKFFDFDKETLDKIKKSWNDKNITKKDIINKINFKINISILYYRELIFDAIYSRIKNFNTLNKIITPINKLNIKEKENSTVNFDRLINFKEIINSVEKDEDKKNEIINIVINLVGKKEINIAGKDELLNQKRIIKELNSKNCEDKIKRILEIKNNLKINFLFNNFVVFENIDIDEKRYEFNNKNKIIKLQLLIEYIDEKLKEDLKEEKITLLNESKKDFLLIKNELERINGVKLEQNAIKENKQKTEKINIILPLFDISKLNNNKEKLSELYLQIYNQLVNNLRIYNVKIENFIIYNKTDIDNIDNFFYIIPGINISKIINNLDLNFKQNSILYLNNLKD